MLHDAGRSVDMLYELEVPEHPQVTQEQLGIYKTGAYTIQIKVQCLCLCINVLESCMTCLMIFDNFTTLTASE